MSHSLNIIIELFQTYDIVGQSDRWIINAKSPPTENNQPYDVTIYHIIILFTTIITITL